MDRYAHMQTTVTLATVARQRLTNPHCTCTPTVINAAHQMCPSDVFRVVLIADNDTWSCPVTTGERPPPCAAFTFTAIDDMRAVVFGGYNEERGRMNDVYIILLSSMVQFYNILMHSTHNNLFS